MKNRRTRVRRWDTTVSYTHLGIEWRTGCNYLDDRAYFDGLADEIVYTGPIDEYFGWSLGFLEYRSLRFEQEMLPVSNYQGNAIVNYTERTVPYTCLLYTSQHVGTVSYHPFVPVPGLWQVSQVA